MLIIYNPSFCWIGINNRGVVSLTLLTSSLDPYLHWKALAHYFLYDQYTLVNPLTGSRRSYGRDSLYSSPG